MKGVSEGLLEMGMGDVGRYLQTASIKRALTECNPGFHFQVSENHDHPMRDTRIGVWFNGRHICSLDRGPNVPEAKVWIVQEGAEDISWTDIDKYDDCKIAYMQILPTDPTYQDAWLAFEAKRDGYHLDLSGRLFHYRALRKAWVPDRILYVGWQHTLHRVLSQNIPGVTKDALCKALGLMPNQLQFNGKIAYMYPVVA